MFHDSENNILVYLFNPFSQNLKEPNLHISCNGSVRPISLEELSLLKTQIITYNYHSLVPFFKAQKIRFPESILDICQIEKLLVGDSSKSYRNNLPWSLLRKQNPDLAIMETIESIQNGKRALPETKVVRELLEEFASRIKDVWKIQLEKLKAKNEFNRYFEIEQPIQNILAQRQCLGICLNSNFASKQLDNIDNRFNQISRDLKKEWQLNDLNNFAELKNKFIGEGLSFLAEKVSAPLFHEYLEISCSVNRLVKLIKEFNELKKDKTFLLRFGAIGEKRTFPIFDSMGTVTGRILVKSPLIQNIRKNSRKIIKPEKGMVFLYPDYSQFEPGILADDSKDEQLINMYNGGDIYLSLSENLFGNKGDRETAKKIFLAFSYGMDKKGLTKLIAESRKSEKLDIENKLDRFFDQFEKLGKWKNDLNNSLIENNCVSTRLGNNRWRQNPPNSKILNSEKRWVISQRIQGTASLILKKAILRVNEEILEAQFLVPMHDAVLYQVPKDKKDKIQKQIQEIFIETFKNTCPSINPKVTFDKFDS